MRWQTTNVHNQIQTFNFFFFLWFDMLHLWGFKFIYFLDVVFCDGDSLAMVIWEQKN
jgi:hypothetical protein